MYKNTARKLTTAEALAILSATMFIDNHVGGTCYPSGSPRMLPVQKH